jgi:hypothetical protein
MVPRFAGASLGLLAFSITIAAGLWVGNPVEVILSRSIFALFAFCLIGFLLGGAAQLVIAEFEKDRESEILKRCREDRGQQAETGGLSDVDGQRPVAATKGDAQPVGP